jgi:tetratricopeptide (TPR) repeat protein/MFS family permease
MGRFRGLLRMVVPSATVFFSSGCLVILVLTGFRLVARHLGSSLYTWTAIVAVVLAGVAVGNYLGGRLADRYHARRTLSVLFGLSSAACVAILIVDNVAGQWMGLWHLSWPAHVFAHSLLVFLLPSCLLGAIIPVAAKTAVERRLASESPSREAGVSPDATVPHAAGTGEIGRTIGGIYAWSAAGGIAAMLVGGFFPPTSNAVSLWLVGAALLGVALLYWISCWAMYLWAMVFAALATMGMAPAQWAQEAGTTARLRPQRDPDLLYVDQTPYGYVAVRQTSRRPDRREFVQDRLVRDEAVMGDVTSLQYFYTKICAGLTRGLIADGGKPVMMVIGGGGYVLPRYLKAFWPGSSVEVVEPDPDATRAAEALGLEHNSAIQTIHSDARDYVDKLLRRERSGGGAKRYDFVYEDTFNDYAVPFPLVTKEFNDKVSRLLAENGIYVVNLIDTYANGRLLGAVVNTLERTFPNVYVVAGRRGLPSLRNSFVVLAAGHGLDLEAVLHKYNEHLQFQILNDSQMAHIREASGGIILTDDCSPVERLLAPVVRQSAKAILARKYFDRARALQNEGRTDLRRAWELPRGGSPDPGAAMRSRALGECERAVEQYRQAIELDPSLSIEAYSEIGLTRTEQGKLEEAAQAFRSAIGYHQAAGLQDAAIAPAYKNLGMLLRRMGQTSDADAQLAQAARWFRVEADENPRSVVTWEQLGGVLAMREDMKGASQAFEKALALEPGNLSYYEKLAKALEYQKRYGEAIEVVRRQIKLLEVRRQRDLAAQARQYLELLEYRRAKQPH